MHGIIRWFVHNHVAANLLMWVLIVAGIFSFYSTYREEFPNLTTDTVSITVPYPGASPEEVETAVCVRVEEAIEGTPGIEKIRTSAMEGRCQTSAELEESAEKGKVLDDIKSRIDSIDSFPEEAEEPEVKEVDILTHVLHIVLSGNADERSLKELAYRVRDGIAELPGVSQVEVHYVRPYEISIEISEHTLRRYGLTLSQVADAIGSNSLNLPGGKIKAEGGEILLRTKTQARTEREFEDIVVLTRKDGSTVRLGEIADVVNGFKDTDLKVRFDGKPAVMIQVKRIGKEDVIDLAERVKDYLHRTAPDLPDGIEVTLWKDESQDLVDRLALLRANALSGLALVLLVLALFLKPSLAFWVSAGIPIAILGSLIFFPAAGISISTMSIVAFILVLGILVDDAVVVGERVYAYQQKGYGPKEAAIEGTCEVSVPVIFGVLTTIVAFVPFLFIPATMGQWFAVIGLVVILALVFSVVESQMILPVHLSHRLVRSEQDRRDSWLPRQLERFASHVYRPFLERLLHWRYLAVSAALALLIVVFGLLASGRLIFQFFPPLVGERVYASLTMPTGTDVATMERKVRQIERAAQQLRAELDEGIGPDEPSRVKHVISSIGAPLVKTSIGEENADGANFAEMAIELIDPESHGIDPRRVVERWRELTGPIPGALEQTFSAAALSSGKPIDIQLRGHDLNDLRTAAARVKEKLGTYPGVMDIADSFRAGKMELKLALKPEARTLGLTEQDLATQVREAFYGVEVQRLQIGKDDVRVMVRYPEQRRRSMGDLEDMMIRTESGEEVPFTAVASVDSSRGYSTIQRVDGMRVVHVQADVDRDVTAPEPVLEAVQSKTLKELQREMPSLQYQLAGEAEERMESLAGLARNCLIALIVMYSLLAIPLKSYLQPFIIMSVIPFGLIGSLLGHFLLGIDLIIFSLLGIVAMAGVVVNSSLVLVDYINRQRRQGVDVWDAAAEAGQVRFRPILLTSLTTFVGLIPMMVNHTLSTFIFVPMAVSLAFGVLLATFITLLLVPAMYLILEDWLNLIRPGRRPTPSPRQTEVTT